MSAELLKMRTDHVFDGVGCKIQVIAYTWKTNPEPTAGYAVASLNKSAVHPKDLKDADLVQQDKPSFHLI